MSTTRLLVVRLGAMGDIIHTLPAVVSLKRSFSSSEVVWALDERWATLLSGNAYIDRVEFVNRRSLSAVLALRRHLRSCRFDMAIDFQGLIKSALVAAFAGPEKIYGWH